MATAQAHTLANKSIFDPEWEKRTCSYHDDDLRYHFGESYTYCYFNYFGLCGMSDIICVNDDPDLLLDYLEYYTTQINYKTLWFKLFIYDSVKCVTAILDGETKGFLEFHPVVSLSSCEVAAMHLAADYGAHRLIKLLLVRGGDPDAPNTRDSDHNLPLNKALEPLKPWRKPTDSIFLEFCYLFGRHGRNYLETVRILAHHTKEVEQEFIKYAMEGSVQQVAKLLLVAREKVMPSVLDLRRQILEKITSLLVHDVRSALTCGTDFLTQKRIFLQVTLVLLEMFQNIDNGLLDYLCLPKDMCNDDDMKEMLEPEGISIDNLDKLASNISYRFLSELFMDQKIILPTCALKHEGAIPDGAVNGLDGLLYPKVQGQLEESIRADDSLELVNLVAYQLKRECVTNKSIFASELLRSICYHNSVECATALLEGKTDLRIALNTALEDGIYPLHFAAISLSPSLTELFLHHEAQTDVKCNNSSSPYHGMFPLELALEALCLQRCVGDWTPTKSIFKLIYIFCLPELTGPLMTVELLASDISVVQKISSLCVQEGKLVELSALLMVSWDMLVSPGHDGDLGSSFIGKHILSELQILLNEESKLIYSEYTDRLQQVRWKKGSLLFALSMLELFKSARAAIQEYRLSPKVKDIANFQVPLDVSNLLRNMGFCLKIDDVDVNDIKCLLREVESERSDVAISSEKDEAHQVKPYILPRSSDYREIYDEVKGYGVYFPMHPGGLNSVAPRSFQSWKIPKTKAYNKDTISVQPWPNRQNYLLRQPSIPLLAANYRSWSYLSSTAKRWVRFI